MYDAYVSAASNKALLSDTSFIDTPVAVSKYSNNRQSIKNHKVKVKLMSQVLCNSLHMTQRSCFLI